MVGSVCGGPVPVGALDDDPAGALQTSAIYHWNPETRSYDSVSQIEDCDGYWMAATPNCTLDMCALPV